MSASNGNAKVQEHLGVDTSLDSNNTSDFTPILERVKAALLKGQSIRLIDYAPEDRQQIDSLLWRWPYALEERRQRHASTRHLLSQAACCVALAVVRKLERLT